MKSQPKCQAMYEQFRTLLKSIRVGKEELSIIRIQLEKQMSVMSQTEEAKSLKSRLA
ncbi:MAG: hypothetical protein JW798_05550 [Prolixibacteraceae bacterium]|nr:hypothetical protein [Prolixibacteraceae bacterium]